MSIQSLCDSVGKWIKDLPILSTFADDESFVNRYWDAAQNSWKKASSNDILLQFSFVLYQLMQEQQRCLLQAGIDFSHATDKLLLFIKECLLGGKGNSCCQKLDECESVGEIFTAFIGAVRKLSNVYMLKNENDGSLYFACSNAWAFVKNLAQSQAKIVTCNAGTKVQNICRMANDLVTSRISKLTSHFMDNAERILLAMFDACNKNKLLGTSWSTSPKVSCLLANVLEFAEQFLDYISSLAALDIEIELELGWVDIEADDFFVMDSVPRRMKRRQVGHH